MVRKFSGCGTVSVIIVAYSPDGKHVLSGSEDDIYECGVLKTMRDYQKYLQDIQCCFCSLLFALRAVHVLYPDPMREQSVYGMRREDLQIQT